MQVMVEKQYYQNVQYAVVKNLDLLRNQYAKGLLSNLGVRALLSKVPILVIFCFECVC